MNSMQLAYRQAAVQGANGFGLLIALYDTLICDLRRAAEAQRLGQIELRARQANHALLVLGFLENWIDREQGGELSQQLIAFYSKLRSSVVAAQVRQSPDMLEHYVPVLLNLRQSWKNVELRSPEGVPDISQESHARLATRVCEPEREPFRWSA